MSRAIAAWIFLGRRIDLPLVEGVGHQAGSGPVVLEATKAWFPFFSLKKVSLWYENEDCVGKVERKKKLRVNSLHRILSLVFGVSGALTRYRDRVARHPGHAASWSNASHLFNKGEKVNTQMRSERSPVSSSTRLDSHPHLARPFLVSSGPRWYLHYWV